MRELAAVFFAALGIYTVYASPRSLPHWLAGGAAPRDPPEQYALDIEGGGHGRIIEL